MRRLCSWPVEERFRASTRVLPCSDSRPPVFSSNLSAFFLPGLIHQFGNLLLTVQGNVLHVQPDGIDDMRESVLGAVKRGSASLDIVRALLGDESSDVGLAPTLLSELIELARVPLRERGLTLTFEEEESGDAWVYSTTFVTVCANALRAWVTTLPAASDGAVRVRIGRVSDGRVKVRLDFQPAPGSLPFPLMSEKVASVLSELTREAGASVEVNTTDDDLEIRFAVVGPMQSFQP